MNTTGLIIAAVTALVAYMLIKGPKKLIWTIVAGAAGYFIASYNNPGNAQENSTCELNPRMQILNETDEKVTAIIQRCNGGIGGVGIDPGTTADITSYWNYCTHLGQDGQLQVAVGDVSTTLPLQPPPVVPNVPQFTSEWLGTSWNLTST